MLWRGGRQSENIEDRRGEDDGSGPMGGGYGGGGFNLPVGRLGGVGLVALIVLSLVFGIDPSVLLDGGQTSSPPSSHVDRPAPQARSDGEDEARSFVSVVLADTEDTWQALFSQMGRAYKDPTLVLFSGSTRSGCGFAQSATGPFYCPRDGKVYLDTAFFDELSRQFGAPGDFADAYVIAHEVGHHVQNLLGILPRVEAAQQQAARSDANRLQVRVELQADCFAGIWAHYADRSRHLLEAGDIDEGLNAAAAIGDDRLQKRAQGYVVPDAFTHGTSQQRVRWFRRGLDQGSLAACDTFSAEQL
ncbi:MAG: zinc metallopeptidase [Rhodospirillales bacterium]|nr:zinc metallopeptidase [Rhodospirillales bacterium]